MTDERLQLIGLIEGTAVAAGTEMIAAPSDTQWRRHEAAPDRE